MISNVWLGFMLASFHWESGESVWQPLAPLTLSALCLYFSGNLANDWFDREWDQKHRPERALPAGLFLPTTYLALALFLVLASCISAAFLGTQTLAIAIIIAALIATYTWFHKRTRWAVIPMGLCRAGLYALGFFTIWPEFLVRGEIELPPGGITMLVYHERPLEASDAAWAIAFLATHAFGLLIYIAGLSLAARYESIEHPPHGMVLLSRAMLFLPLAAMSAWWMSSHPIPTMIGLLPFAIWLSLCLTVFRRPIPRLVSGLLAGIPLIDLIAVVPLVASLGILDSNSDHHPLLLAALLIPISAFILGRLLQKIAPAT